MNEFKIEGTTLAGYAGNGGTVVINKNQATCFRYKITTSNVH